MRTARIAGVTFLVYIAAGIATMAGVGGLVNIVLSLTMCFSALVLGATLYRLTCDVDRDVALIGMACRIAEGVLAAMFMSMRLAISSAAPAGAVGDVDAARVIRTFVQSARAWNTVVAAMFFAVGSLLFALLFLRGRKIPIGLARLGVAASIVLVGGLPLQLAGTLTGSATTIMWLPMLVFEVPLGVWLIVKGVGDTSGAPTNVHVHWVG